ncbi:MAG TPA: YgcG family protein, partial [Steroidobacteraceae bacterium]|nr:YgcG family protein [Steroidobacteraceae bacterium]
MTDAPRRARLRAGLALPVLLGLALGAAAQAPNPLGLQPVPKFTGYIVDLTGTLTAEQQNALEQKLGAFEAAKGSQLAVLIVPTTQPEEIEAYSIRVVEQWKVGRKKADDGVLLLVAKNDRRVRIEVGRGLEGVLTDATSNRIIDETIRPAFRQGDYYGGIDASLGQMMKLIEGEPLPPPDTRWQSDRSRHNGGSLPVIFFMVLIGSVLFKAIFGRTIGSLLTGGGAGLLVWLAGYAVVFAGGAALVAFLLAMLSGAARGSGWSSYPGSGGWGGFG